MKDLVFDIYKHIRETVKDDDIIQGGIIKPIVEKTRAQRIAEGYEEIAKKHGLNDIKTKDFVTYMTKRWGNSEVNSGYGDEWAERFSQGNEWISSDLEGQGVLKKLGYNDSGIKEALEKPVTTEEKLEDKDKVVKELAKPEVEVKTEEVKDKDIDKDAKVVKVPEGVLPVSPSILTPQTINAIKEEDVPQLVLGEFSDEQVAKDFALAKKGQVAQNPETKKWQVTAIKEDKKSDEIAAAITKAATSLLRKIHKADSTEKMEEIMDALEKSATTGKISAEQETRLKSAWTRRKDILASNPTAPETEPTAQEEQEIEGEVKDTVAPTAEAPVAPVAQEPVVPAAEAPVYQDPVAQEPVMAMAEKTEKESEEAEAKKDNNKAAEDKINKDAVKKMGGKVKEDVEVTLKTDDKETHIVSTDGGVQVTTLDTAPVEVITQADVEAPVTSEPAKAEAPVEEVPAVEEPKEEELPVESKKELKEDSDVIRRVKLESYLKVGEKFLDDMEMLAKALPEMHAGVDEVIDTVEEEILMPIEIELKNGGPYEAKVKERKSKGVKESSDDFTLGFAEAVQKSLSTVLGTKVELSKVTNQLKTMDRIGLEALKNAVVTNDKNILSQFLAELVK